MRVRSGPAASAPLASPHAGAGMLHIQSPLLGERPGGGAHRAVQSVQWGMAVPPCWLDWYAASTTAIVTYASSTDVGRASVSPFA